jgi:phosphoserine aminotransferase
MNIPFQLSRPELDQAFLEGAERAGMEQLKGHRTVGGMRASLYNAMSVEGVQALVDYMRHFERQHA